MSKDLQVYEFDVEIKKQPLIDATFIEFPYDVEKEFGVKGQVKVVARFDGVEYQGSLAKMGHHCHVLGLPKEIRIAIKKEAGDTVHVVMKRDESIREVEVPEDFYKGLDENNEAKVFFQSLSYTNKKKYVQWITGAKKEETRIKRISLSVDKLLNKIKRP